MKKFGFRIILMAIISCFLLSSCDDVKAVMSLIPKFDGKLPNVISGKYAYFPGEDKSEGYGILYTFDSNAGTFKREKSTGDSDTPITVKGSYSVEYDTYTITKSNGNIFLYYEDGTSEFLRFYYYATATDGPEYIKLSDDDKTLTYYYQGK